MDVDLDEIIGSGMLCPTCHRNVEAAEVLSRRCAKCENRLLISPAYNKTLVVLCWLATPELLWVIGLQDWFAILLLWFPAALLLLIVVLPIALQLDPPKLVATEQPGPFTTLGLGSRSEHPHD